MKPLAVRTLYFALTAIYLGVSSVAAEPKRQYSGFSRHPHPDSVQVNIDYLHNLEMIKVKASPELQQAVKAIPVESDTLITPEQEADLRDWLYAFLVAFSVSGSDSLAAAFYLREGVNNPDALERMKKELESRGLLKGDTPFELFQAKHRATLDNEDYEYRFGNVSFLHSVFKVFKMKDTYESYLDYARAHGMVVARAVYGNEPKLRKDIEAALQAGEHRVFTNIMFITEEPEESSKWLTGQIRTPLFFRLAWDPERAMWRFVEAFYNSQLQHFFLIDYM
ncbi:MAG: hypothetical protein OXH63_05935 [Gemmatimonadetes bacterium]|nr:hypothetical protein [Gemmatimonadota bacterium]